MQWHEETGGVANQRDARGLGPITHTTPTISSYIHCLWEETLTVDMNFWNALHLFTRKHTLSIILQTSVHTPAIFMNPLYGFNVFHVRLLYYTKTLITNKCTRRGLSSIVTHSYMFRPCWVIFRENFLVIVTLRSHFIVEWKCAVDCVLLCFWRREP
jgi:hypothetical protein